MQFSFDCSIGNDTGFFGSDSFYTHIWAIPAIIAFSEGMIPEEEALWKLRAHKVAWGNPKPGE